jgi:hypothetical protein
MQPWVAPDLIAPGWMQLFAAQAWLIWYLVARWSARAARVATVPVAFAG